VSGVKEKCIADAARFAKALCSGYQPSKSRQCHSSTRSPTFRQEWG